MHSCYSVTFLAMGSTEDALSLGRPASAAWKPAVPLLVAGTGVPPVSALCRAMPSNAHHPFPVLHFAPPLHVSPPVHSCCSDSRVLWSLSSPYWGSSFYGGDSGSARVCGVLGNAVLLMSVPNVFPSGSSSSAHCDPSGQSCD